MLSRKASAEMITPETFDSLYDRFIAGDENVMSLFQAKGDLFLCQSAPASQDFERLWIFDADDTLWEDNIYYEEIISELSHEFISAGVPLTLRELRSFIDDIENEIIPQYGFGPLGFEVSMQTAFARLSDQYAPHLQRPDALLDGIVPKLSQIPYEVPADHRNVITELRARGDCVVLFTQGPLEIQLGKIARSGLASSFHGLAVGKNKNRATYQKLLDRLHPPAAETTVVGNSLRSEVKPALELGLRAVHFRNPNTWHVGNSAELDESQFRSIDSLVELLEETVPK